ncbi:hypothetical protein LIER_15612 [Lithospermum erythrorhizon]|uniref:Cell division cycle protein 123 n=1 Tax=Lithospermum erythrorhizon TaxID=34254 RepID=A0AAV3Q6S1_LITER
MDKVRGIFDYESYTLNVYVTTDDRVKLLDFNTWAASTLPLFTWEELEEMLNQEESQIEFRIVDSQSCVRPGMKTAVPYDYLDTSPGSGWDQFLSRADETFKQQTASPGTGA